MMTRVCRYARVMTALGQRLAERTLELVDIPSESLHEAEVRSHLLSLVPAVVILVRKGKEGRKTSLPFAPFLAGGALIALFYGDAILDAWLG